MNQPFTFTQGKPLTSEEAGVRVTRKGVHLGAEITGRRPAQAIAGCAVQGGRGGTG